MDLARSPSFMSCLLRHDATNETGVPTLRPERPLPNAELVLRREPQPHSEGVVRNDGIARLGSVKKFVLMGILVSAYALGWIMNRPGLQRLQCDAEWEPSPAQSSLPDWCRSIFSAPQWSIHRFSMAWGLTVLIGYLIYGSYGAAERACVAAKRAS
jgi:hypothetical protein